MNILQAKYRFNRNASSQTWPIFLGAHKYNLSTVAITERKTFGVYIIAAITRYGKSTLVKNAYVQIGQHRPVIILDYLGEHTQSKFPNFMSEDQNTNCLPLLFEIKDFKFKVSQFNNENDWHSLTFTDRGAMLMATLAQHYECHRDDPELFWEMLDAVPMQGQYAKIKGFEEQYGFNMPMYNTAVIDSCKAILKSLNHSKFFGKTTDLVYDFGEIALKNNYLNINFNLGKTDISKGRAMAGKVLEQLRRAIPKFVVPPLIVVEEADVLAPEMPDSILIPSSTLQLVDFVIKLQKWNIEIMFIVQDPRRLNQAIVGNKHVMIIGQLPANNEHTDLSRQLVWDIDKNYREFILLQTGVSGYQVFVPFDSMSMY